MFEDDEDEGVLELATPKKRLATNLPVPDEPDFDYREIGVNMSMPFVTAYQNQWEIPREDSISVEKLVSMRKNDGQARALYRLMTLPILAALKGSTFTPAEGKEGGTEEAKFVENMFRLSYHAGGMEISLHKIMEHFLLALFDGFSASEIVYYVPAIGPNKDKWVIRKIAPRPSETISFVVDDNGNYSGLRQRAYSRDNQVDVFIPKDRALYFSANEAEKMHYGQSYFHAAFFHWDKKSRLYYLAHIMAQRSAASTRIGTYPKGTDPKKLRGFTAQVSDVGTNQYMIKEEGFDIDALREGGSFDFLGLINHHNSQMSKSVLAEFFDQNQGAGKSDGSMVDFGKQSDTMFILMLEFICNSLEELINNEIIPRFIQWNFNNDMYPVFKWGPITKDQRQAIIDVFKNLMITANQGNVTPDFVFEAEKKVADAFGFELDYDKIEREKEEQAQAEKDQMEQMQAQTLATNAASTATPPADGSQPLDLPADLLPQGFA